MRTLIVHSVSYTTGSMSILLCFVITVHSIKQPWCEYATVMTYLELSTKHCRCYLLCGMPFNSSIHMQKKLQILTHNLTVVNFVMVCQMWRWFLNIGSKWLQILCKTGILSSNNLEIGWVLSELYISEKICAISNDHKCWYSRREWLQTVQNA